MSSFTSATLGQINHPINILQEFLKLFSRGNKCKAAILSWLDGRLFCGVEWVRVTFSELAEILGYCRETIAKHIKELVDQEILQESAKSAGLFPTDTAKKYKLNVEKLLELTMGKTSHLDEEDFASYYILENSSKQQQDVAVKEEFLEPDWDMVEQQCREWEFSQNTELPIELSQSTLTDYAEETSQHFSALEPIPDKDHSPAALPSPVKKSEVQKDATLQEKCDRVTDAKIRLNPQLRHLLTQFTLEEVQNAIALYQATKQRKTIHNSPGWLTDCLRGKWWVSDCSGGVPNGFNEWYKWAKQQGLVQASMLADGVLCVVLTDGDCLSYEEARNIFGSG